MCDYRSCKRLLGSALLLTVAFLAIQAAPVAARAFAHAAKAAGSVDHAFHAVVIKDFKYQPPVLTVKVGDTVEWKNADIFAHTVTAVDKSFDSGSISPGGSWKFVAKKTGSFNYFCTFHPNMTAKLIVR